MRKVRQRENAKKVLIMVLLILAGIIIFIKSFSISDTEKYMRDMKDSRTFIDPEEKVLYAFYQSGDGAGFTEMTEKDGSVKIHDQNSQEYKYAHDMRDTTIFVDFEENVMYSFYGNGEGAGLTVMKKMRNSVPKLYNPTTSIYKNVRDIKEATILVYKENNTMYAFYKEGNGGGLCEMLKADGSPKLYNKDTSIYKNIIYIAKDMIYVDKDTNNMFLWYQEGEAADVTKLLNYNGSPRKKTKFSLMYNKDLVTRKFIDYEEDVVYIWFKCEFGGGIERQD